MDEPPSSHWRQMFDRERHDGSLERSPGPRSPGSPPARQAGYDDGFDPGRQGAPSMSPENVTEEAALALAVDTREYRPWTLQRGRSHPAMMLHLRRFEPRSGLWMGWQLSYPHLVAVEYTGDKMFSLDFGTRQFVITGNGLGELVGHLQTGTVLTITEHSNRIWPAVPPERGCVSSIACAGQAGQS